MLNKYIERETVGTYDGIQLVGSSDNNKKNSFNFEFWGWIIFIICSGFFIAASIKHRDTLSLIASIIFLIACLVFITPLITKGDKKAK